MLTRAAVRVEVAAMLRLPTTTTWYDATSVPRPERPELDFTLEADACVVGGGFAGLHVARELARRGWTVAVLEASRIAAGASGRNGGFVIDGFAEHRPAIEARLGFDQARALHALSREGLELVRRSIAEERMPGVEPVPGSLRVTRHPGGVAAMHEEAEHLARRYGQAIEFWPRERVAEGLRTERYYGGLYDPGAFHIHPLNFAIGLAAAAQRQGVRIYENSPAVGLDLASLRRSVRTPKGRVRCDKIILCGSALLPPQLDRRAAAAVVPVSTFIAVTEPLPGRLEDSIRFAGAVSDTRRAGNYFRVVGGNRLLWGGGITTRNTPPRRLARQMAGDIAKSFPGLAGVGIDHAWSGIMGYARHKMPQIGEIGRDMWIASAFGGHGLNTTAMAGLVVARALAERDDRYRLFRPYGLDRTYGLAGKIAAQLDYWRLAWADRRDERRGASEKAWHPAV
jgi:gamma-glutamylputrescine oxidase